MSKASVVQFPEVMALLIRLRSMGETVSMFIKNLHVENTVMYHNSARYIIIAYQSTIYWR